MKIGSLFSGYGGLDLAVERHFNAETVWHAEWEQAPSAVLKHHWPEVQNFHDVTAVDWSEVEPVNIITGGFPCQDVSSAGRRAGMVEGTRSNLWGAMRTAVEVIRPQYVIAENVRGLLSARAESESDSNLEQQPGFVGNEAAINLRALGRVLGDLADLGYDAQWHGVLAADVGAPHNRFRVFILATDTNHPRFSAPGRRTPTGNKGLAGAAVHASNSGNAEGNLADNGFSETTTNAIDTRFFIRPFDAFSRHNGTQNTGICDTCTARGNASCEACSAPSSDTEHDGRFTGEDGRSNGKAVTPGGGARSVTSNDDGQSTGRHNADSGPRNLPAVKAVSNTTDDRLLTGASRPDAGRGDAKVDGIRDTSGISRIEQPETGTAWGAYEEAVRRWERCIQRPAPRPTEPSGKNGEQRLSPKFVEWMMGLPEGWVTEVPDVTRANQLKMLGNGVVPHQAEYALKIMTERVKHLDY